MPHDAARPCLDEGDSEGKGRLFTARGGAAGNKAHLRLSQENEPLC